MKSAIQDRDPQNRDYYEENYNKAIKEFEAKLKKYNDKIKSLSEYKFITLNNDFDYLTKSLNLNTIQLDNHEMSDFIKINNLDPKKVIIIVDGGVDQKLDFTGYNTVSLWKYDGNTAFDDLILWNVQELAKWAPEKEIKTSNNEANTTT